MWESQTAESALRWHMRYVVPHHNLELILEVILTRAWDEDHDFSL